MKGIAHFVSAVAAATFISGVTAVAGQERSLLLVLAGVFGLLPDWLDFRIARYFEPADEEIAPTAPDLDAQEMADRIAGALHRALEEDTPLTVQLHPAQVGPDLWRRYSLQFDAEGSQIVVRPGPMINGHGVVLIEGPQVSPAGLAGRARVRPKMRHTYGGEITVEAREGPSFEFSKVPAEGSRDEEGVEVSFLPWHRRWSHSLVLAGLFGLVSGALFGERAGWVVGVAFATHVLEDQLGYLGSNLWWPFTQRRSAGLKLVPAGDPLPNFLSVLTACGLVLYNLNRFAPRPAVDGNLFLLWAVLVPAAVGLLFCAAGKQPGRPEQPEAAQAQDALSEIQETEGD